MPVRSVEHELILRYGGAGRLEAEACREHDLRGGRQRRLESRRCFGTWWTLLRIEDLRAIDGLLRLIQQRHVAPRRRDGRVGRSAQPGREAIRKVVARRQLARLRKASTFPIASPPGWPERPTRPSLRPCGSW